MLPSRPLLPAGGAASQAQGPRGCKSMVLRRTVPLDQCPRCHLETPVFSFCTGSCELGSLPTPGGLVCNQELYHLATKNFLGVTHTAEHRALPPTNTSQCSHFYASHRPGPTACCGLLGFCPKCCHLSICGEPQLASGSSPGSVSANGPQPECVPEVLRRRAGLS